MPWKQIWRRNNADADASRDVHPGTNSDQASMASTETLDQVRTVTERLDTEKKEGRPDTIRRQTTTTSQAEPLHSIFTTNQKRFIVFIASWAGLFSPVSATIYFPALNALASDLHVSNTLINLTLTSYMIFQGLAPSFIGNLADATGRRPAYIVCFTIYIAANIGLAVQNSYAALFVLRCLQSTGSSATIAMASAVVSDIATPAERGKYMGFTTAGSLLGPAFGPVIGGILTQYLSWRAVFWFLVIFAGCFLAIFLVSFPETARPIVGNGSIPARGLNMSLMNYLAARKTRQEMTDNFESTDVRDIETTRSHKSRARFPNPFASFKIIFDKANALLLLYNAFVFAAFYDITATIPSQFATIYGYNDVQIGLCYIATGVGPLCAALLNGQLLDRNFKRWCFKLGVVIKRGRNQDLRDFPIEKVRLQLALPAAYISMCFLLAFGWILDFHGPMPALLVMAFFTTFFMTIAFNVTSTLLIDFYPKQPATATAANNLVRCLLGAAATGLILPMINGMGIGWTFTFLSFFLFVTSPMLWVLMWKGMDWRKARLARGEEKDNIVRKKMAGALEDGSERKTSSQEEADPVESDIVIGGTTEMVAEREELREKTKFKGT